MNVAFPPHHSSTRLFLDPLVGIGVDFKRYWQVGFLGISSVIFNVASRLPLFVLELVPAQLQFTRLPQHFFFNFVTRKRSSHGEFKGRKKVKGTAMSCLHTKVGK